MLSVHIFYFYFPLNSQYKSRGNSIQNASVPEASPWPSYSYHHPLYILKQKTLMKASQIVFYTFLMLLPNEIKVSMTLTCSTIQLSLCVSAIVSLTPLSNLFCSKIGWVAFTILMSHIWQTLHNPIRNKTMVRL